MRPARLRKLLVLPILCTALIGLPWDILVTAAPFTAALHMDQTESSEISIVTNGGFENGLDGWNVINQFLTSSGLGYPSISKTLLHSGSAAVILNFLSSNYGGGIAQSMELTGIYQTANISGLTGLHVQAWFSMRQGVSAMAARMRVRVNGLEVKYYVAYDYEQRLQQNDNATSKAILAYQIGPGQVGWWELNREVLQDFQSLFGPEGQAAFQKDSNTVTVALELMGFGPIPGFQMMLWDDVQALAKVSVNAGVTTTATTTVLSAISLSSSAFSTTSALISSHSPASSTATEVESPLFIVPSISIIQRSVVVAVVLTLVTCFFLAVRGMRKRALTGVDCTSCGAKDLRTDSIYCPECGKKLYRPPSGGLSNPRPSQ